MSPKTQLTIGIVLIGLGVVAAVLQITQHQGAYSLVAVFLGAVGGQQIGQGYTRGKQ